jgi:heat shock protein HtpX
MFLACPSAKLALGWMQLGGGVYHLGYERFAPRRDGRNGGHAFPDGGLSFDLIASSAGRLAAMPRFYYSGMMGVVEADLATASAGLAVRCRVHASAHDLSRLQRRLHRDFNERRSGRVMAGMVLLLALCGWINGGDDGARRAISESTPRDDSAAISPEAMRRRFGARPLLFHEMPALFEILQDICRRANLARLPALYFIAAPHSMNAYALGGPEGSAITLTEGLLRGMTLSEIAGILAHEVAHIRNNDGWAMRWAAALHQAITRASLVGLMSLRLQSGSAGTADRPLAVLLGGASAIGQLLCLALSRIREFDADACALELIDDVQGLVAALHKLERHHAGTASMSMAAPANILHGYLRSHPETRERVGNLMSLAHSSSCTAHAHRVEAEI